MTARAGQRRSNGRDEWFSDVFVAAVIAFFVLIPTTYVLLLALRLVLFATGLVHYADLDQFLTAGTSGVFYGSLLIALLSAKGTLKKMADDGPSTVDIQQHLATGLVIRAPFALLVAGLTGLPEDRAARIVVGIFWGAFAASAVVLDTVIVHKHSVLRAAFPVLVVEGLITCFLIVGVLEGLRDRDILVATLELAPAAAAACASTYLVI